MRHEQDHVLVAEGRLEGMACSTRMTYTRHQFGRVMVQDDQLLSLEGPDAQHAVDVECHLVVVPDHHGSVRNPEATLGAKSVLP